MLTVRILLDKKFVLLLHFFSHIFSSVEHAPFLNGLSIEESLIVRVQLIVIQDRPFIDIINGCRN